MILKLIDKLTEKFIKIVFCSLGILLLYFSCNSADFSEKKGKNTTSPNFILILADDQGWNGTSVKMMQK
ncbi:MAG: hypothetical protein CM15mP23_09570 [Cryomorphaceae bacterium]|nr:MAG: hypothetical protein CM15mP23_09570 [Cryomorphaceae bacterium]